MNKSMRREITGYVQKAAPESRSGLPLFVLSEERVDRMGDIVRADGWDLEDFRNNPIALLSHSTDQPIGTWQHVRVDGKRLLGELKLASTPLAQTVQTLIDEDVLRAVSVGFRVNAYEPIDRKDPYGGWDIKSASLFEVSVVAVPALPSALLVAKRLGLSEAQRRLLFADAGQSPRQQKPAASGMHPSVQRAIDLRSEIRALIEIRK